MTAVTRPVGMREIAAKTLCFGGICALVLLGGCARRVAPTPSFDYYRTANHRNVHGVDGKRGGPLAAGAFAWQFGTGKDDEAAAVCADSRGNIIVAGQTNGALFAPNNGDTDLFLAKYDAAGNLLWGKQRGTSGGDYVSAVAVDRSGGIYLVGATEGDLFGPHRGSRDIFVCKYDAQGVLLWAKQFGAPGGDNGANDIAVDAQNNVYVAGDTEGSLFATNRDPKDPSSQDAFLIKYDQNGRVAWAKQFGAAEDDWIYGLAVDGQGHVFVAGSTDLLFHASTGDEDACLAKFTSDGKLLWGRQFGSRYKDAACSVCVDARGSAYVTGYQSGFHGTFNPDHTEQPDMSSACDGFVAKYDPAGKRVWIRALTTPDEDVPRRIRLDSQGDVLVAGTTQGALIAPNAGDEDVFLAKFGADGRRLGGRQFGTSVAEGATDFIVDAQGGICLVGYTNGALLGTNSGGDDAFIQKFAARG